MNHHHHILSLCHSHWGQGGPVVLSLLSSLVKNKDIGKKCKIKNKKGASLKRICMIFIVKNLNMFFNSFKI